MIIVVAANRAIVRGKEITKPFVVGKRPPSFFAKNKHVIETGVVAALAKHGNITLDAAMIIFMDLLLPIACIEHANNVGVA